MLSPEFKHNMKRQIEENPVWVLGACSALLAGAAQLMNANTNRRNSVSWRREVKRREKIDRRRK